jgi:hypothetical protein
MGEMPNAYQCDYCRKLMIPIEKKDARWHTKWCSLCGVCVYDVFVGDEAANPNELYVRSPEPEEE